MGSAAPDTTGPTVKGRLASVLLRPSPGAILAASLLCLVLGTSVFVGFTPDRQKIVRAPLAPASGRVHVALDAPPAAALLAIIVRIDNASGNPLPVTISAGGGIVCRASVPAGAARRVDCATAGTAARPIREVDIQAPGDRWRLDYLEVANEHGSSRGALTFVILPSGSTAFERPSAAWLAAAWILLVALLSLPASGRVPGALLTSWRIAASITIAVFALSFGSGLVSPYKIVLSAGTFLEGVLVLVALRAWRVYQAFGADLQPRRAALARSLLVACTTLAIFGIVAADRLAAFGGNYSGFVQVSRRAYDRVPFLQGRDDVRRSLILLGNTGYDGQFMYFAAFDPFLRTYRTEPARYDEIMDAAPYRYGRIAFSVLVRAVSGGQWERFPAAMVWIVLSATFLTALLLALLAVERGASPAWGALVLLVPGFWRSLQMALPESLAAAALLCGILLLGRRRFAGAGLAFALALLTRETSLAFVAFALAFTLWRDGWKSALPLAVAALLPPVAWHLYVGAVLSPVWGIRAYFFDPQIVGLPLEGIVRMESAIARGAYGTGLVSAAATFPLLLAGGLALACVLAVRQRGPVAIAAAAYAVVALSLNYANVWSHAWNAVRASYEMFLLLGVASLGLADLPRSVQRLVILFWGASAAYVALYGW